MVVWPDKIWIAKLVFWTSSLGTIACFGWFFWPISSSKRLSGQSVRAKDWNPRQAYYWVKDERGVEDDKIFHVFRQAASEGTITVWGRKDCSHLSPDDYESSRVLEPIPKEHWVEHDFDTMRYIFDDDENNIRQAATPKSGYSNNRYCDLRLTSSEVKSVWPAPNRVKTARKDLLFYWLASAAGIAAMIGIMYIISDKPNRQQTTSLAEATSNHNQELSDTPAAVKQLDEYLNQQQLLNPAPTAIPPSDKAVIDQDLAVDEKIDGLTFCDTGRPDIHIRDGHGVQITNSILGLPCQPSQKKRK